MREKNDLLVFFHGRLYKLSFLRITQVSNMAAH